MSYYLLPPTHVARTVVGDPNLDEITRTHVRIKDGAWYQNDEGTAIRRLGGAGERLMTFDPVRHPVLYPRLADLLEGQGIHVDPTLSESVAVASMHDRAGALHIVTHALFQSDHREVPFDDFAAEVLHREGLVTFEILMTKTLQHVDAEAVAENKRLGVV